MYIGYEINRMKKYCLRYIDCCIIGGYGVTFNQRASCLYQAKTNCSGFFVRKPNWVSILDENPEIAARIKQKILTDYIIKIRSRVNVSRNADVKKLQERRDHQNILILKNKQDKDAAMMMRENFGDDN